MQLGLPKRVLAMATPEELQEIRTTVTMSKQFTINARVAYRNDKEKWRQFRQREHQAKKELRYWRLLLRQRYALSMREGLYTSTRSNCYGRDGRFGNGSWVQIPKGSVLVWVERNELGWNSFMLPNNQVVAIKGTDMDAIAPYTADTFDKNPDKSSR